MPDEPNERPDEIQGILSELDQILSGTDAPAEPPAAPPAKPSAPPPPAAKAEPPKPIEIPKAPEPPEPPKPAAPPAEPKIELAPREGTLPAAKKAEPAEPPKPAAPLSRPPLEISLGAPAPAQPVKPAAPPPPPPAPSAPPPPAAKVEPPKPAEPPKPVEPPKPAEPPKAAEPPKPVEPPKPAAPPAPTKPAEPAKPAAASEEIPAATPKDQIRRVAYVYTFAGNEARLALGAFLSQAARTISKKPLFLRQVLALEVGAQSDPEAVYQKAREAKAVAVLAVVEGWPAAKVDALSEACSRGAMLFRSIPPGDVQKKSTAVDVIVDMMLLPGES